MFESIAKLLKNHFKKIDFIEIDFIENNNDKKFSMGITYKKVYMISIEILDDKTYDLMLIDIYSEKILKSYTNKFDEENSFLFIIDKFIGLTK